MQLHIYTYFTSMHACMHVCMYVYIYVLHRNFRNAEITLWWRWDSQAVSRYSTILLWLCILLYIMLWYSMLSFNHQINWSISLLIMLYILLSVWCITKIVILFDLYKRYYLRVVWWLRQLSHSIFFVIISTHLSCLFLC